MNEYDFGSRSRPQKLKAQRPLNDKIQYLLGAEEQLLQSISARAPLPKVLNEICSALDCQIGNVVSLISLPDDDAGELGSIATNAELFGLYNFCSELVVDEHDQRIASLEMYGCVPRSPSATDLRLIERAKCLAALAIKLDHEAGPQAHCAKRVHRPVRGLLLEWPPSMN
jgi:hypothetical protein